MECICLPTTSLLNVNNIQDLQAMELPNVNPATDLVTPPHLNAMVPHELNDCPEGEDNPGPGGRPRNRNHPKRPNPTPNGDRPPKKDAKKKTEEGPFNQPQGSTIKKRALPPEKVPETTTEPQPQPPQVSPTPVASTAVFGMNILIGFVFACICLLLFRKL
eukprot:TRINITY_DN5847_c0_g1_i1.p1 TRINITY_DN5847_c0_g1~~TRINITY_DN5847_c0_g1_i1.p1  ORF type:complete len:161 (-),score=38.64 TRINITY_DN5847_c0_g1_i1:47-529(-)